METLATWELWRFSGANVRCPGPRTLDYSSRFNKRTWLGAGGWNQEPGLLGAVSHIPVPGARCLPHGPARLPRGPWGQGSQPGRGPRPWARPWAGPAVIMPFAPCWAGAWKPTPGLSLTLSVWAARACIAGGHGIVLGVGPQLPASRALWVIPVPPAAPHLGAEV